MPLGILGPCCLFSQSQAWIRMAIAREQVLWGFFHARVCVTMGCSVENDLKAAVSIKMHFVATRPLRDSIGLPSAGGFLMDPYKEPWLAELHGSGHLSYCAVLPSSSHYLQKVGFSLWCLDPWPRGGRTLIWPERNKESRFTCVVQYSAYVKGNTLGTHGLGLGAEAEPRCLEECWES